MVGLTTAANGGNEELLLAQLACTKLVGLVQGALSIGLPALVTGVPDPRLFLEDRFRVLTAFSVVLHTVSWPGGRVDEILRLRETSAQLLAALQDLQGRLFEILGASELAHVDLRSAQGTASALFDSIGEFARLVGLDSTPAEQAKASVIQFFDAMYGFDTPHAAIHP